ncbi:MAG: ABC transporter ATP-binding protein [Planctomycetaceae bacterium]
MIELSSVTIRIGDFHLKDLSFRIDAGQYAVVMGKTGIGKTTILEAICGLRSIHSGRILISGVDVTRWTPADRNVGYMPQDLALFPSMTVREHIEFAMKVRNRPAKEMADRVAELANLLEITPLLDRRIKGLSGGESQRVALGRALSFRPGVLLLDEPLSALDEETRLTAQGLLKNLNKVTGVTILHVTHNQEEADALGDYCIRLIKEKSTGNVLMQKAGD